MKKKQLDFGTPDEENPELTDDFYKNARPFYEVFPQFKPVSKKDTKPKKPTPRHLHAA